MSSRATKFAISTTVSGKKDLFRAKIQNEEQRKLYYHMYSVTLIITIVLNLSSSTVSYWLQQ